MCWSKSLRNVNCRTDDCVVIGQRDTVLSSTRTGLCFPQKEMLRADMSLTENTNGEY